MADRRRSLAAPALALGLVALAAAVVWTGTRSARGRAGEPVSATADVAAAPPAPAPGAEPTTPDGTAGAAPAPRTPDGRAFAPDAPAVAWASVDMEAVREAMPDNLYWKLAMPTQDAAILREREEIRAHWNGEFGKVQSNTATEAEVRAYYAHRRRLSADYVEFATYLLDHYGDTIPERDVGLLELAREMHLARLEEIPRRVAEALERREAHEAARRAWLEEQARFEQPPASEADPTRP
jgi:hypothetical protein